MKSLTTIDVLFITACTFPFLMSLCIFYREYSWQSDRPRAWNWWSISARVSATLSQMISWTFALSGILAWHVSGNDDAGYAVVGGAVLSLFGLVTGLRSLVWHRVANTAAAFVMTFGWLVIILAFCRRMGIRREREGQ
jgi:hypothetical protein